MTDRDTVLEVDHLTITYGSGPTETVAVDDVSFVIRAGEIFGLAGESGSGKSTIANAILGLLGGTARIASGSITCDRRDVLALNGESLRRFRWDEVSMVFQSAMNALNPVMSIGDQIVDVLQTHRDISRSSARQRARELLESVGIEAARATSFPHELSGGMRQRAVIAIAMSLQPKLLILDEPTTALDVVVQQEIINEIRELQRALGFAVLFITHDLSLMVEVSQRLAVMRHGAILETGDARAVYAHPQHAYTHQLVEAFPPVTHARPSPPQVAPARETPNILELQDVSKEFRRGSFLSRHAVTAVDDVDLVVRQGEIVALVGESGSGKSTIARILARLERPSSGVVVVDGATFDARRRRVPAAYRRTVQMVFQDPFSSLNPTQRIRRLLERPLILHAPHLDAASRAKRVRELMREVDLREEFLDRYPHELSGGQRQRVAIARALAVDPKVIIADEPTSMLDVSVRMGVLQLMRRLRDERGLTLLYITHDLASARYLSDRVVVMLRGSLVEGGPSNEVMDNPLHPYTQLLVSAAPDPARDAAFDRAARRATRDAISAGVNRRAEQRRLGIPRLERVQADDNHWIDVTGFVLEDAR